MAYAQRLAVRIRNVLKMQVQDKGYEVQATLIKKQLNDGKNLSLTATSETSQKRSVIKIIVTEFDQEEWPMELGDNSQEKLDFISIETEETPLEERVEENNFINYDAGKYKVRTVSPTGLGGLLIIKECRAEKVM